MIGARLSDGVGPQRPGEYAYMPYDLWELKPSFFLGEGEWHAVDPSGGIGAFGRSTVEKPEQAHSVERHEDGTITVYPSLVMPSGWHGWLVRGEWRS